jgi:hypothetical protein
MQLSHVADTQQALELQNTDKDFFSVYIKILSLDFLYYRREAKR